MKDGKVVVREFILRRGRETGRWNVVELTSNKKQGINFLNCFLRNVARRTEVPSKMGNDHLFSAVSVMLVWTWWVQKWCECG